MAENTKKWSQAPEKITIKDATIAYIRWFFSNEIPHSKSRLLAPSLLWALMPILRKLYKDEDALKAAYKRQLEFFNTQLTLGGGMLTGVMSSMEQRRANQEYNDGEITTTDSMMNTTKTGLMGALAGIGDSIDSGTIQYIFLAIALPWAQRGLAWGAIFPFIGFVTYQILIGIYFARLGFTDGREAANILNSSKVQNIIAFLSILGMFMMGIVAENFIFLETDLAFSVFGNSFVLQEVFDSILPGLLPIVVVMGVYYYYIKRGLNANKASLWVALILGVLAIFGVL
jgi:PTS system mannose-specific IID component